MRENESLIFKNSFWLGRLIWVSGSLETKNEHLEQMLSGCGVSTSEVFRLNAHQFIDVFSRGFFSAWLIRYEVFVVSDFEHLSGDQALLFLKYLGMFCDLKSGHSLQLVLSSSGPISPDLNRFRALKPVEIVLGGETEDPGEANEQIHDLLTLGMKLSGVRIGKISERAAIFLEEFLAEEGEGDTLLLILNGLLKTNAWELRLQDLVSENSEEDDDACGAVVSCF